MAHLPTKQQIARDRRDGNLLQRAAAILRRRAHLTADLDSVDTDEALAYADVFDAAARDVEGLAVGLRSGLLAAADLVARNPSLAALDPTSRAPGAFG
ncbi:MAG TPA: hypothetical protein VGH89_34425 [Pseudonocardia sp.]